LPTSYDAQTGTVTATVSHFCLFALFVKTPATPTPAAAPVQIPGMTLKSPAVPPPPTAMSTFSGMILWAVNQLTKNIFVVAGVIILVVGISVLYGRMRRSGRLINRP
jgi:hypothetical protein